jgi:hypothetical protein
MGGIMHMIKAILKYLILLGVLALFGCATMAPGYGTFVPDQNVPMNLESFQIDPDMNYYFSGPFMWPDAIIGVKKAYRLDSTLWRKIVVTPELVRNFVSTIKSQQSPITLYSYAILDDKGKQIGVWYSSLVINSYIKMEDERTVDISTPINPTRSGLSAP